MPATTKPKTNRARTPKPGQRSAPAQYDFVLLAVVATLVGLGLVMIFSASFVQANQIYGKSTFYFFKQLQWLAISVIVMLVAALTDYRILKRFALIMMAATVLFLLAVLLLGTPNLGSRRHLFGTSVQPSEIAKLTVIIYIAYWLSSKGDRLKHVSYGLVPFAVLLGLVAMLIVVQPDVDTTVLVVVSALIMFFVAGADLKQLGLAAMVAVVTFVVAVTQIPYTSRRLDEFLSFLKDPTTGGYQVGEALKAFAHGGLLGQGLGDGSNAIPLAFTDSIFAVVGEELGLVGTLLVVTLFMVLAYRGLRIALRSTDSFGLILGCGITGWLAVQAFINMAVNTATLPFSGLTLPFVSYGGSSLLACMAGVGVLLSISRYGATTAPSRAAGSGLGAPSPDTAPRAAAELGGVGATYATLGLRWRNWRPRLSNLGRTRRPRTAARHRPPAGAARSRGSSGYAVKTLSAPRTDGIGRRVTRAKRTIARRTSSSRRKPTSSRRSEPVKHIPRRR